jgi:pilus assembly protein Flp/PilA
MLQSIKRLLACEKGVVALEYGLIGLLIAVVIVSAVSLLGTNLKTMFSAVATVI